MLPEGRSRVDRAPGLPFPFRVHKTPPPPPLIFWLSSDDASLVDRTRNLLSKKAADLQRWKEAENSQTIPLFEFYDLGSMSPSTDELGFGA